MSDRPLADALARLDGLAPVLPRGRLLELTGLVLRAAIPGARAGDLVRVLRSSGAPLLAEVVGFAAGSVTLMPLGEPEGVGPDCLVEPVGAPLRLRCGRALLGRVLDGLGQPIDGGPAPEGLIDWAVDRPAPAPLERPRISRPLGLGVRALDGLLTMGEGQRIGLFAGSGVGKSTLLGQLARNTAADVVVIALCGERGREVREFIDESLGPRGLQRSVVVCATSDAPPLLRLRSAQVATAVAEFFRDEGARVLLLMDSVTRFARALREVALAAGEPPARRGFPPSVFARLPRLLERTGTAARGSISAIYTVLVEGDDLEEPVADEVRGILDGHVVLSRELSQRGHWPAVDVLRSVSRTMPAVTRPEHRRSAEALRRLLSTYERQRDLILLGAYQRGTDRETDEAMDRIGAVQSFLQQRSDEDCGFDESVSALRRLFPV
jgi:ATP synthase in type III secretion protein N